MILVLDKASKYNNEGNIIVTQLFIWIFGTLKSFHTIFFFFIIKYYLLFYLYYKLFHHHFSPSTRGQLVNTSIDV